MADIFLKDLGYDKPEIDQKFSDAEAAITLVSNLKSDKHDEGAPGGIATLDGTGRHPAWEIPFASVTEGLDPNNTSNVMHPRRVYELLLSNEVLTKPQMDLIYGNLRSDGTERMDSNFNPQFPNDIATVKYVQDSAAADTSVRVVDTMALMFAIPTIIVGDITFVTNDGANTGEYLCTLASVGGSTAGNWSKRTAEAAWGSLLGNMDDQTDLKNALALKADLTVTDAIEAEVAVIQTGLADTVVKTTTNKDNISSMASTLMTVFPTPGKMVLEGILPTIDLAIKAGGGQAVLNVIDEQSTALAAQILYDDTNEYLDLRIFNKATNALEGVLSLAPNGEAATPLATNVPSSPTTLMTAEMVMKAMTDFYIYEYVKEGIPNGGNPIIINANSYQPLANLNKSTEHYSAGTYEITFGVTFMYSSTSRSAHFTWSIDGGTTWEDFIIEPKDKTNLQAMSYTFPHTHLGGGIDLVLQGKCENGGDTLTVNYANIVFERKK